MESDRTRPTHRLCRHAGHQIPVWYVLVLAFSLVLVHTRHTAHVPEQILLNVGRDRRLVRKIGLPIEDAERDVHARTLPLRAPDGRRFHTSALYTVRLSA